MEQTLYDTLTPIFWAAFAFPVVLFMQRWINRHLQGVTLLLTGRANWSIIIYAVIMFPGVLLHELSHWITANLLGVRTGRFSLLPKLQDDGSLRLGYVEYYKSPDVGPVRETLIGGAPLIFGTSTVLIIGLLVFDATSVLNILQDGTPDSLSVALNQIFSTNDFWLWLYLLFAISNAMMPSPSDRRAWPAFLIIMGVVTTLLYILGFQEALWRGLTGPVVTIFGYIGLALSMTIAVNLIFMLIIGFLEWLIGRVRGAHIQYG
ncbi:MAG: hypothetical protein QNJ45_19220 [Ardenticatenaceae bacterium]|nr:hypothetical protein [Ardenticatenaceae bacterium]